MNTTADPTSGDGVCVEGLSKSFGQVPAVRDATFVVSPGEVAVVLGRNGAGKSTLLRILATTILPDEGSAFVARHDVVADEAGARASCGTVLSDERSFYWPLSGRRNLIFFAALRGLPRRAAVERADELLDLFHLSDVADRRFAQYSSGMRARLAIARAFLGRPSVLLLDEPSKALDPIVSGEVRALVVERARRDHVAVLWATHDLHEAAAVADRLLLFEKGRPIVNKPWSQNAEALQALVLERMGGIDD